MSKTEIVFARLKLDSFDSAFQLEDTRYETPARLYEVLNEEFYAEPLTKEIVKLNPEVFAAWSTYRTDYTSPRPEKIQAVAKFEIQDQKVTLLDIRFN